MPSLSTRMESNMNTHNVPSLPSRIRKAASARRPPPSTSHKRSRSKTCVCCSSTSTPKATPARASACAWKPSRARLPILIRDRAFAIRARDLPRRRPRPDPSDAPALASRAQHDRSNQLRAASRATPPSATGLLLGHHHRHPADVRAAHEQRPQRRRPAHRAGGLRLLRAHGHPRAARPRSS